MEKEEEEEENRSIKNKNHMKKKLDKWRGKGLYWKGRCSFSLGEYLIAKVDFENCLEVWLKNKNEDMKDCEEKEEKEKTEINEIRGWISRCDDKLQEEEIMNQQLKYRFQKEFGGRSHIIKNKKEEEEKEEMVIENNDKLVEIIDLMNCHQENEDNGNDDFMTNKEMRYKLRSKIKKGEKRDLIVISILIISFILLIIYSMFSNFKSSITSQLFQYIK